tara:strand:- start:713 stop:1828 length:1116 start_codon:yes stop_codon:yes gene_type:complete
MKGLNDPIGYKSNQILQNPFIMNPFRFSSGGVSEGGWKELGRVSGSASVNMTVDIGTSPPEYLMYLSDTRPATGNGDTNIRLGNTATPIDTANNYASRLTSNGSGDATNGNIGYVRVDPNMWNNATPRFSTGYISNKLSEEKLMTTHTVDLFGSGAGTAPDRAEVVGKWANTTTQINYVTMVNLQGNNWSSDSEFVVLGYDTTYANPTSENFWEELSSVDMSVAGNTLSSGTFTSKKYLWVQGYTFGTSGNEVCMRVGNTSIDSGSNYAYRYSSNGGADSTEVNKTQFADLTNVTPIFWNYFIINDASYEKIVIGHATRQNTSGESNAPTRFEEVGKWVNTSSQIDIIDFENTGASGEMSIGTKIRVWGSN